MRICRLSEMRSAGVGRYDGGGPNPLSGYSILEAESIDAASEVAKGSPHVEFGGTIEVAEVMEMKPS